MQLAKGVGRGGGHQGAPVFAESLEPAMIENKKIKKQLRQRPGE